MVIAVDAVFEDGSFRPKTPVPFREHELVRLVIETPPGPQDDPADEFVGFIKDAPTGVRLAAEHDRHLYDDERG
jgi:predicted DNA-binding antitoxin AbrB/MazE fold protein